MSRSLAGSLLIATPNLIDPNFIRTVVLIFQHDEDGALGVVLNRDTGEMAADHLPQWAHRVANPGVIHYGGPVEPEVAIALAEGADGMSTGVPGLSLVDLTSPPEEEGPSVRIYSGYSGWAPGQLEEEISTGSWYVVQAAPDDPFDDPTRQWQRVLKRQPGHLSLVSTFPDDPNLN